MDDGVRYFVDIQGTRVDVEIMYDRAHPYLRTDPRETTENLLLWLPERREEADAASVRMAEGVMQKASQIEATSCLATKAAETCPHASPRQNSSFKVQSNARRPSGGMQ
jgi:hypothetical protein